jgi:perosamine synthetase
MIFLDSPEITDQDIAAVTKTLRQGQISTAHETTKFFEDAVKEFLGVEDCVATNSGTSALHLALLACGAGRGTIVVLPALSFVATANAVKYTGADIKFMDVDPDTWSIFDRPCVIEQGDNIFMPVFLYGGAPPKLNLSYPATLDDYYRVKVVWDFSEAWGLKPPECGIQFNYFCYSMNGNKTITAGAGGVVAGPDMTTTIRSWVHPRACQDLAYNYRMPSLNAALAWSQLTTVMKQVNRKREIAKIYKALLPEVKFQKGIEDGVVWMVAGTFELSAHCSIDWLQGELLKRGIPTRRTFPPLNHYRHLRDNGFYPNAEYIYEHGLCLPSSVKNTDENIKFVCKTIKELCFS